MLRGWGGDYPYSLESTCPKVKDPVTELTMVTLRLRSLSLLTSLEGTMVLNAEL